MEKLGLDYKDYNRFPQKYNNLSFVLINPPNDFDLNENDIIYLLKPGNLSRFK
jgi:hypothetical protein